MSTPTLEALLVPYATKELSDITGIARQHISEYRAGVIIPSAQTVQELAWAIAYIRNDHCVPTKLSVAKVLDALSLAVAQARSEKRSRKRKKGEA